ncbi:glycoside hydrolase [Thozetella sp. PMI_491]|nr:glycoside hydrolase [Thozetella sp. PMI_491]
MLIVLLVTGCTSAAALTTENQHPTTTAGRERTSLNAGWRFWRAPANPDKLVYDIRPDVANQTGLQILKPWILPSANDFLSDPASRYQRPAGSPWNEVSFLQPSFDDSGWELVDLPHDWAIKGPFYTGDSPVVGGGMGRLPVHGIGWYRRTLVIDPADRGKSVYLDIDGAMSYAMVWLNGNLVGGWPYGYNSFRLDLSPYLQPGNNQLAIRLDNPVSSSRWYPGGGIYRNVWLTTVESIHVSQWGTYITSKDVSTHSAVVDLTVTVENKGIATGGQQIEVVTDVYAIDMTTGTRKNKAAEFPRLTTTVSSGEKKALNASVTIKEPQLWGPAPSQQPSMYAAVTRLYLGNKTVDTYETRFGIRSVIYDSQKGVMVNGVPVHIRGVNQHHDLGALGGAFNVRAAERQLETLQELGCNAIRMSHNPPAPELLDLADRMGFLVMDEIFDCWQREKTTNDFHLIFDDWHEADLRSFVRRDRNHPSIIYWSVGNEVGEQYTDQDGAAIARKLRDIAHEEDPTRPVTASMNYAKPNMSFPTAFDVLSLNYQGEGIRDTPAYANLSGISTPPLYPAFHSAFPDKMLQSTETAATVSTRGTYFFPVTNETSAPVSDLAGGGGNPSLQQVSAYELYSAPFGASPDKVFAVQDNNSYVAGDFVWSGWDYLGEPTPYYTARSSYFGIVDLAGFKKDRAYLYQARWRPDFKMAHILPHWSWPDRVGQVVPVHVFSSADEAELFLNGESLGRRAKQASNYRFRWDNVTYQPGELQVITYKDGVFWAKDTVRTSGSAAKLQLKPDRSTIGADGVDLSFITAEILDFQGALVPQANNTITFSVSGPGEIVATDNGDPAGMVPFPSPDRPAYNGLALVIVRSKKGAAGEITVTAAADGITTSSLKLKSV